jgi:hypothetical protein
LLQSKENLSGCANVKKDLNRIQQGDYGYANCFSGSACFSGVLTGLLSTDGVADCQCNLMKQRGIGCVFGNAVLVFGS